MNSKLTILLIVFSQFVIEVDSQNLVQNHSFELYNSVPTNWTKHPDKFNKSILNWDSPNTGSPDIIFDKSYKYFTEIPIINLKNHVAFHGRFFVGLRLYGCHNQFSVCREYLQTQLLKELVPNHEYKFSVMVKPSDRSIKINNIGIALSKEKILDFENIPIQVPTIIYESIDIIEDSLTWTEISTTFKVEEEGYNYLLIGNFHNDLNTSTLQNTINSAYYLFDHVILEDLDAINKYYSINFTENQWNLNADQIKEIETIVNVINQNQLMKVSINGFASSKGGADDNLELSRKRALEVFNYLDQKIDSEIIVKWSGEEQNNFDKTNNRIVVLELTQ